MALLICKDVHKTYKVGDVEVPALRGVDLTMERGSFTMITGASGSGKSTLMHCIAGIDKPDSGEILIDGTDIHSLSRKKNLRCSEGGISDLFTSRSIFCRH